jgi:hypothetical protein
MWPAAGGTIGLKVAYNVENMHAYYMYGEIIHIICVIEGLADKGVLNVPGQNVYIYSAVHV